MGVQTKRLNRSLVKFRQIRHSRRICWIRQNCRFVNTPISSSIALWRNFVKIAIVAGFIKIAASSVPLSRAQSLFWQTFVKIAILAGFIKIVALSVPPSRAQSLFGEICQNRHSHRIRQNRRFVGTPISS